jgi:hypothetical protein
MTKHAKFLVAVLLIASVLFALRLCHPHTGEYKHQQTQMSEDHTASIREHSVDASLNAK